MNVSKNTDDWELRIPTNPSTEIKTLPTLESAPFITIGSKAASTRSYLGALQYWAAWLKLRYNKTLEDGPVPLNVVVQFVEDHVERFTEGGQIPCKLPPSVDQALVKSGIKGKRGPLAYKTIAHRLSVLEVWHTVCDWAGPTKTPAFRRLMREIREESARRGKEPRRQMAAEVDMLQAMLTTCSDGVRGIRDRALLLLAWSCGGPSAKELTALQVSDVVKLDALCWRVTFRSPTGGEDDTREVHGAVAQALGDWFSYVDDSTGPFFPRLFRGNCIGTVAPCLDEVPRMIRRRANLAGLPGYWGLDSLKRGFVREARRRGLTNSDIMAAARFRKLSTLIKYLDNDPLPGGPASHFVLDFEAEPNLVAQKHKGPE